MVALTAAGDEGEIRELHGRNYLDMWTGSEKGTFTPSEEFPINNVRQYPAQESIITKLSQQEVICASSQAAAS